MTTTTLSRLERALLALLMLCTLAAVAGYASYGLHPQLMGSNAAVARTYALALTGFPRLHILLGFLALAATLLHGPATRWIASACAVYAASLGMELLGTIVGRPFGPYRYTDALGPKWFGFVPLLIPLSWCTMTIASFAIARRILRVRSRLATIATGAVLLIAWDLALDPAMSRLTPYWVWGVSGPYFGMPLLNLAGWFVTGVLLHAILFALRAERWLDFAPLSMRAMLVIYGANVALPVGMTVAAGIPLAAAASLVAVALTVAIARLQVSAGSRAVRHAPHPEIVR